MAAALLLAWQQPSPADGAYSFEKDGVATAGQSTFEDLVVYSGSLTLVVFYSPACRYCVELEPKFKAAAKQLAKEGIKAVAVDAVLERGLANFYNVSGYPTFTTSQATRPSRYSCPPSTRRPWPAENPPGSTSALSR